MSRRTKNRSARSMVRRKKREKKTPRSLFVRAVRPRCNRSVSSRPASRLSEQWREEQRRAARYKGRAFRRRKKKAFKGRGIERKTRGKKTSGRRTRGFVFPPLSRCSHALLLVAASRRPEQRDGIAALFHEAKKESSLSCSSAKEGEREREKRRVDERCHSSPSLSFCLSRSCDSRSSSFPSPW